MNAVIYGHDDANEIVVDNGVIKSIGKELGPEDEIIDLVGKLVTAPYVDPHVRIFEWLGVYREVAMQVSIFKQCTYFTTLTMI